MLVWIDAPHPPDNVIEAYALRQLADGDELMQLVEHLLVCEQCRCEAIRSELRCVYSGMNRNSRR